ncbi:MAG TPA: ATP-grasp domain-containing protein [Gemmatimonadales bacterium]|nr:ATP-grasp domain-containing protein [Gemmatimonadales bacterium]
MKEAVLITDGEQRAALATVRSLGRCGYRCILTSADGRSLAGASRYAAADHALPPPLNQPEQFAEAVAELVRREGAALVLPIAEPAMLALLAQREALSPARVPFPDLATFRDLSNKALLLDAAPACGIAVPAQHTLRQVADLAAIPEDGLRFPIVAKPARSVAEADGRRYKLGVSHAASRAELAQALEGLPAAAYPVLLQERIVGPGVGIFLLLWRGELVAQFAHRRLREKPPSGGVSVYRESIAADPELVARSRALLERFGWQGVAMVEYKLDERTGTPYLMEVNGRFWGSLQLAIDAGVDFPALLADRALGRRPAPVLDAQLGVRSRWWWGDVDHLLARLRRSDAELALPPGAPRRARALLDFGTLWRPGDRNEILRWSDPAPFFRESRLWLSGK